jgi:NhaA family Na+:H+ antiporter
LAAGIAVLVAAMHRAHVTFAPVLVAVGLALWLAVYESGVHATIAGVLLGLLTPARPHQSELEADRIVDVLEGRDLRPEDVRATATLIRGSVSACDRLIDSLHPWTGYLIVPVFALANAGIELSSDTLTDPSSVLTGVALGLVLGKFAGITAFSWVAVRLGLGRLPEGAGWAHIAGVGAVAGIGFTVSLFIAGLAFESPVLLDDAKAGILTASAVAAVLGAAAFVVAGRRTEPGQPAD